MYFGIPKEIISVQYKNFRPAPAQYLVVYLKRIIIRERETVFHLSEDTLCSFCCLSWTRTSLQSCWYSTT